MSVKVLTGPKLWGLDPSLLQHSGARCPSRGDSHVYRTLQNHGVRRADVYRRSGPDAQSLGSQWKMPSGRPVHVFQ
jgi:hypothetical protein